MSSKAWWESDEPILIEDLNLDPETQRLVAEAVAAMQASFDEVQRVVSAPSIKQALEVVEELAATLNRVLDNPKRPGQECLARLRLPVPYGLKLKKKKLLEMSIPEVLAHLRQYELACKPSLPKIPESRISSLNGRKGPGRPQNIEIHGGLVKELRKQFEPPRNTQKGFAKHVLKSGLPAFQSAERGSASQEIFDKLCRVKSPKGRSLNAEALKKKRVEKS